MSRTCLVALRILLVAICLVVGVSTPLLAQRSDRGTISGVVTDEQGAAVPGATVTITNEATGVETAVVTNTAGAYTTPPLVLGTYRSKSTWRGSSAQASDILLRGATRFATTSGCRSARSRRPIRSQAAIGLDVTTPDVGHTVNEKYLRASCRSSPALTSVWPSRSCRCSRAICRCGPTATRCSVAASSTRGSTAARRWRRRTSSTAPRSGTPSGTSRATRARRRSKRSRK